MAINWGNASNGALAGGAAGSTFGPWGTAIGAGIGGLAGLFGDDEDPTEKSRKLLEQIPEKLRPYFEPYFNTGKDQLPQLSGAYGSLVKQPDDVLNSLGKGYKQSPGYQWNLEQGEKGINNAYAAGGMAGSNEHGQAAGTLASHLADQDFQDYLNHAIGLFGTGLSGSQNLATMGQQAGQDFGNTLGENLGNEANLGISSEFNKNQQSNALWANILQYLNKNK